jgi:hypothetical protein
MGGAEAASACGRACARLPDEPFVYCVDGGVVLPPKAELSVEEDLVVGTVPCDSLDESDVRKLAFERRRSSLKKGMASPRQFKRLKAW